jgi:hypothetical protein
VGLASGVHTAFARDCGSYTVNLCNIWIDTNSSQAWWIHGLCVLSQDICIVFIFWCAGLVLGGGD